MICRCASRTNNLERAVIDSTGLIGLGITNPKVRLQVSNSVLFGSDTTGAGNRFYWNTNKAALRAGGLTTGNYWDTDSTGIYSVVIGAESRATGNYSAAFGYNNIANASGSFAAGIFDSVYGTNSAVFGNQSYVGGAASMSVGASNRITGLYNFAAGLQNRSLSNYATVTGHDNRIGANSDWAAIIGGAHNQANERYTAVVGGNNNIISGFTSSIFGGYTNTVSAGNGVVVGGIGNTISGGGANGYYSAIFSGYSNTITSGRAGIFGGDTNTVAGQYGIIIGGIRSTANGYASKVMGSFVTADDSGAVVLADMIRTSVAGSNKSNQFTGIFNNGYRFLYNRADTSKGIFINQDSLKVTSLSGTGDRSVLVGANGVLKPGGVLSAAWELTGNAGTDTTLNFIGTVR